MNMPGMTMPAKPSAKKLAAKKAAARKSAPSKKPVAKKKAAAVKPKASASHAGHTAATRTPTEGMSITLEQGRQSAQPMTMPMDHSQMDHSVPIPHSTNPGTAM